MQRIKLQNLCTRLFLLQPMYTQIDILTKLFESLALKKIKQTFCPYLIVKKILSNQ